MIIIRNIGSSVINNNLYDGDVITTSAELQHERPLHSAVCPLIVPVKSLGTGGTNQCGSVPGSAGCRYT